MSTNFLSGKLVKSENTCNETNTYSSELWTPSRIWLILSAESKKSLTVYMLFVGGFKSSKRYFPTGYWVVPAVSNIGQKGRILLKVL